MSALETTPDASPAKRSGVIEPPTSGWVAVDAPTELRRPSVVTLPGGAHKQLLGHRRGSPLVGMGKPVATRRGRPASARQSSGAQVQAVTDIVEPKRLGQLRIQHRDLVAPALEGPRLLNRTGIPRNLGNQGSRNEVEYAHHVCI